MIDSNGLLLDHREFPANDHGYHAPLAWMRSQGTVSVIGVESTGSFRVTLTRALTQAGVRVVEVNRPNRSARRIDGKSDRLDAEQIARAVLNMTATATPKSKSGTVEVIRTLPVTRASAVKSRTQAFNTLLGVMIGAPRHCATSLSCSPSAPWSTGACGYVRRSTTCSRRWPRRSE